MNIYAISDLHLAPDESKSMDVFGPKWENHFEKIKADWLSKVNTEDTVLIPGDHSWAMNIEEAKDNIAKICELPGKKILLKGNHDYWWSSLTKVRAIISNETYTLQNDCIVAGDYVICGTRGWILPSDKDFTQSDNKIFEREKIRLELSLSDAEKKYPDKSIILMMHYPPVYKNQRETDFQKIIDKYNVKEVVFGHIHGFSYKNDDFPDLDINGVRYSLISCDYLDFKLKKIV